MTEPINLQSILGLSQPSLSTAQFEQARKALPLFPLQNLTLDAQLAAVLAGSTTAEQNKISLSVQSLATIITNAVVKTTTAIVGMFLEKLAPLFGEKLGGSTDVTTAGSTGANSAIEETATPDQPATSTNSNEAPKEKSWLDSIKNAFGKIGDFIGNSGIGDILKSIATAFIPGGLATKILTKWTGFGELFDGALSGLLSKGAKLLDTILPGASDTVTGLVSKGKSLLKKIF